MGPPFLGGTLQEPTGGLGRLYCVRVVFAAWGHPRRDLGEAAYLHQPTLSAKRDFAPPDPLKGRVGGDRIRDRFGNQERFTSGLGELEESRRGVQHVAMEDHFTLHVPDLDYGDRAAIDPSTELGGHAEPAFIVVGPLREDPPVGEERPDALPRWVVATLAAPRQHDLIPHVLVYRGLMAEDDLGEVAVGLLELSKARKEALLVSRTIADAIADDPSVRRTWEAEVPLRGKRQLVEACGLAEAPTGIASSCEDRPDAV